MTTQSEREGALEAEAQRIEAVMFRDGAKALNNDDRWYLSWYQGRRLERKVDGLIGTVQGLQRCLEAGGAHSLISQWRTFLTPRNLVIVAALLIVLFRGPEALVMVVEALRGAQ